MKGIILSGGEGTRLRPLTKVTSKQLLPIYNKPMIYYPLEKLLEAGIKEILIIVAPDHCGDYMKVLGSGKEFGPGVRFTYEIQDKPEGLAQAFIIAENFLDDGDSVTMILGDNLFDASIKNSLDNFQSGASIFVKEVPEKDRNRFGIVEFDEFMQVKSIEEKPQHPKSSFAQTGIYTYDNQVVAAAKSLQPSARGELEITDLNNWYLQRGQLKAALLDGEWIDAGTFESFHHAHNWAYNNEKMKSENSALTKKVQLRQQAEQHAQIMMELYRIDSGAFAELSIRTPSVEEVGLLTPDPGAQQIIQILIEQRRLIQNLQNDK